LKAMMRPVFGIGQQDGIRGPGEQGLDPGLALGQPGALLLEFAGQALVFGDVTNDGQERGDSVQTADPRLELVWISGDR
jgi:hypothetical protein